MRVFLKLAYLPSAPACRHRSPRLRRLLRTQAQYEYTPREDYDFSEFPRSAGMATPRQVIQLFASEVIYLFIVLQLVQYLDEYVVGQQEAKKVLSVA